MSRRVISIQGLCRFNPLKGAFSPCWIKISIQGLCRFNLVGELSSASIVFISIQGLCRFNYICDGVYCVTIRNFNTRLVSV